MSFFNKRTAAIILVTAILCGALLMTSCIGAGTAANKTEEETTASPAVAPAEISEDTEGTALTFGYNENEDDPYCGSIITCEYKKDDVNYIASYNYIDGEGASQDIEIYLFGGETVSDVVKYKSSAKYDRSLDEIIALDGGYFIKGFKEGDVTLVSRDSDAKEEESEKTEESVTDTQAESGEDSVAEDGADAEDTAAETKD